MKQEDRGASLSATGPSQAEPEVSALRASVPSAARKVDQHFAVANSHYDYDFSPGAGIMRLTSHDFRSGGIRSGDQWWSGDYVDYRGIVSIQMDDRFTRLDAVVNGRCHTRSWRRGFGDRTVTRLCRAFLTDLNTTAALTKESSHA